MTTKPISRMTWRVRATRVGLLWKWYYRAVETTGQHPTGWRVSRAQLRELLRQAAAASNALHRTTVTRAAHQHLECLENIFRRLAAADNWVKRLPSLTQRLKTEG